MRTVTAPPQVITVGEALRRTNGYLAGRGVDTPRLDAELLLAHVLDCERIDLYTGHERPLTTAETDAYRHAVARRGAREPVAYITGRRGFRRLALAVSSAVLVPRPETELLVEWALELLTPGATVLDWGTGSGAIALALADEGADLAVTGIDRSDAALTVARANDPVGRVEWLRSDSMDALAGRAFDLVVANPPYVAAGEMSCLAPELGYEPHEALVSGPTGLECYELLARELPAHLNPGGGALVEVGIGQAAAVAALWRDAGFERVEVRRDLAGIDRAVGGRR